MGILFDIRLIFFLIIAGVVAYFGWEYHERGVELATSKLTIANQKQAITDLQTSAAQVAKTDTVTANTNAVVLKQTVAIDTSQATIQNSVAQKVQQIENAAIGKPDTPASEKIIDDKTAAVEMDGMWQTYCGAVPTDPQCPQVTPTTSVSTVTPPSSISNTILKDIPTFTLPTFTPLKLPTVNPTELLDKVF